MTTHHILDSKTKALWKKEAQALHWFSPWKTVLAWQEPFARWFAEGTINASHACLDVHMSSEQKNKIAIHWEGENNQTESLTYEQLFEETNRFCHALQKIGVIQGDIVVLYLPMIPQSIAAMLAVARLGAIHSVVFSGFSSEALRGRINDSQAKFLITADFGFRRGKVVPLQAIVEAAALETPSIKKIVVIKRDADNKTNNTTDNRIVFYHDIIEQEKKYFVEPIAVQSTNPLFILYTSGTTGKPKGILHSTGGYLTYVYATFKWVFAPGNNAVYFCTADIGWITGHSYVVYAPLMHGVTIVMQEGTLDYPTPGRWWELIEKYKVSILYTSPTALRMCKKLGDEWPQKYNLSSLKLLGTVGEPINPEVWQWYHSTIGKDLCPVIDTWWQTETGGFMIAPTAGRTLVKLKPGSATLPLPSIDAAIVDSNGNVVPAGHKGYLVIQNPWPGMMTGILNDDQKFKEVYWTKFNGMYYTGDYAIKDADGYFWLLGRADEVVNIAGHRIGTIEIENSILELKECVEVAAIGVHDDLRGEAIIVFAAIKPEAIESNDLKDTIRQKLFISIGKFVLLKEIYFVTKLPKTRSGKIMRRLIKAVLEGKSVGDMSTIEDEASIDDIKAAFEQIKITTEEIGNKS